MRTILLSFALTTIALTAQTLQFAGRVLTNDGKPIEGAQIRIAAPVARSTAIEVSTNAQGTFTIENVPTGLYTISVTKPGFLPYQSTQRESQASMEIRLGPASSISGRATDLDGKPLPKASITAYRYSYTRGARSLNPAGYTIVTDAEGLYTFPALTAGRYYLRVEAAPPAVATYYPSTLDPGAAAAVDVETGATRSGVDIRQRTAPAFRIRGKALTASGDPAPNAALRILAEQPIETLTPARPTATAADGSFEFTDLLPGSYVIRAAANGNVIVDGKPVPAIYSGRANVTITRDNVEDFRMTVTEGGFTLAGTVKMEDTSAMPAPPPPTVQAPPGAIIPPNGRITLTDAEQTFTPGNLFAVPAPIAFRMEKIPPAKYYVSVVPMPANTYIKSIRYGGQDLTRSPIDLLYSGGDNLEIILSAKAATVNAVVRNSKGEALPRIAVALWPDKTDQSNVTSSIRLALTDGTGTVRFSGLRPEKYRLTAFADTEQGFVRSPDFLDRFRARATELEVGEGATLERTLEPISREDAAIAIRNLQ